MNPFFGAGNSLFAKKRAVSDEQLIFWIVDDLESELKEHLLGQPSRPQTFADVSTIMRRTFVDISNATRSNIHEHIDFKLEVDPTDRTRASVIFVPLSARGEKMIELLNFVKGYGGVHEKVKNAEERARASLEMADKAHRLVRDATNVLLEKYQDEQSTIDSCRENVSTMEADMKAAHGSIEGVERRERLSSGNRLGRGGRGMATFRKGKRILLG